MWSSDIATQRMLAAVDMMNGDLDELEASSSSTNEMILQGTRLRRELLASFYTAPSEVLKEGQEARHGEAEDQETRHSEDEGEGEGESEVVQAPISQRGIFANDQMIQSWATRYQKSSPLVMEGDPSIDLNESQVMAMAMMIGNPLSLVQGVSGSRHLGFTLPHLTRAPSPISLLEQARPRSSPKPSNS